MTPGRAVTQGVAADTSLLINLTHIHRLDLLKGFLEWEFLVPQHVLAEITDPGQAQVVADARQRGCFREVALTAIPEIELYAELHTVMGAGEAACLALAESRGCLLACDERGRFLREATTRLGPGRVINTAGLLLTAIRNGILSVEEADRARETLASKRFRMKFESFRDLI